MKTPETTQAGKHTLKAKTKQQTKQEMEKPQEKGKRKEAENKNPPTKKKRQKYQHLQK